MRASAASFQSHAVREADQTDQLVRVEINIATSYEFAVYFLELAKRRLYDGSLVNSGDGNSKHLSSLQYRKAFELHKLLKELLDCDETLKAARHLNSIALRHVQSSSAASNALTVEISSATAEPAPDSLKNAPTLSCTKPLDENVLIARCLALKDQLSTTGWLNSSENRRYVVFSKVTQSLIQHSALDSPIFDIMAPHLSVWATLSVRPTLYVRVEKESRGFSILNIEISETNSNVAIFHLNFFYLSVAVICRCCCKLEQIFNVSLMRGSAADCAANPSPPLPHHYILDATSMDIVWHDSPTRRTAPSFLTTIEHRWPMIEDDGDGSTGGLIHAPAITSTAIAPAPNLPFCLSILTRLRDAQGFLAYSHASPADPSSFLLSVSPALLNSLLRGWGCDAMDGVNNQAKAQTPLLLKSSLVVENGELISRIQVHPQTFLPHHWLLAVMTDEILNADSFFVHQIYTFDSIFHFLSLLSLLPRECDSVDALPYFSPPSNLHAARRSVKDELTGDEFAPKATVILPSVYFETLLPSSNFSVFQLPLLIEPVLQCCHLDFHRFTVNPSLLSTVYQQHPTGNTLAHCYRHFDPHVDKKFLEADPVVQATFLLSFYMEKILADSVSFELACTTEFLAFFEKTLRSLGHSFASRLLGCRLLGLRADDSLNTQNSFYLLVCPQIKHQVESVDRTLLDVAKIFCFECCDLRSDRNSLDKFSAKVPASFMVSRLVDFQASLLDASTASMEINFPAECDAIPLLQRQKLAKILYGSHELALAHTVYTLFNMSLRHLVSGDLYQLLSPLQSRNSVDIDLTEFLAAMESVAGRLRCAFVCVLIILPFPQLHGSCRHFPRIPEID